MGYTVYITRRKNWFDEFGQEITWEEWKALVAVSPDMRLCPELGEYYVSVGPEGHVELPWICWESGNLETKNPSREFLVVLAGVAERLNARLVGEEGESYDAQGEEVKVPLEEESSWRDWLDYFKAVLEYIFPRNLKKSPFKVGDRVKTSWGRKGRVVKVDMRALGGMGIIEVDFGKGQIIGISGDDALEKAED